MTDQPSDRESERERARAAYDARQAAGQDVPELDERHIEEAGAAPRFRTPEPAARDLGAIPSASPLATPALDGSPVSGSGPSAFAGSGKGRVRVGDRIFRYLTASSGAFMVLLISLVAVFLLAKAVPSILDDKVNFFTSRDWQVSGAPLKFGIVDMLWTTVLSSVVAMLLAVPVAVGIALFITQYATPRLARPVAFVVDLLAAVPSIIYGVWGIYVLAPKLDPVRTLLTDKLGWFPLFKATNTDSGTVFVGAVVLSIMILPIVTAISREVYERTPRANVEAAWALGATRWEMIRLSVMPHGRPGVISGAMLGLGRALGETIAITLILSTVGTGNPFNPSLFYGGETFASKIANAAAEFNDPKQTGAYIAAGLVLFVLTFAVNAAARVVVNRRKEFS
jgi:phosphate transport system permease protein